MDGGISYERGIRRATKEDRSMLSRLPKPSPALALAFIAVLIAMGGTAGAFSAAKPKRAPAYKPNLKVVKESFTISSGEASGLKVATCPEDYHPFAGGYSSSGKYTLIHINAPLRKINGWGVGAIQPPRNPLAGVLDETAQVDFVVYCAPSRMPIVLP